MTAINPKIIAKAEAEAHTAYVERYGKQYTVERAIRILAKHGVTAEFDGPDEGNCLFEVFEGQTLRTLIAVADDKGMVSAPSVMVYLGY